MTGQTERRISEIRRRVKVRRQKHDNRVLSALSAVSAMLALQTGMLLCRVKTCGVASVRGVSGTVLLHHGDSGYVMVGVAAFVCGAAVTLLGIRYKRKINCTAHKNAEEEKE